MCIDSVERMAPYHTHAHMSDKISSRWWSTLYMEDSIKFMNISKSRSMTLHLLKLNIDACMCVCVLVNQKKRNGNKIIIATG